MKRELKRKETKEKEKHNRGEIKKELSNRIVDLSYRKLKENIWSGIERLCEKNKEIIIKKIIELMEDRSSIECNRRNIIMKKLDNNSLCESKLNEMITSISGKINKKLENNNWYLRLVKGWKSIVKTEREVKLRHREPKGMGRTRGHKKNKKRKIKENVKMNGGRITGTLSEMEGFQ